MYPHAGGDYVYLREAYHPVAGFLVGWLSFFVIYAGTVATLAVGFAEGLAHFVPISGGARIGAGGGDHHRHVLDQLRRRAHRGARQQRHRGDQVGGARRTGVRRAAARRRRPRPLRSAAARQRRAVGGVRPGAVAGAVQLPGLERVGVRRERDPRSAAQRSARRCSPGSASARSSTWSSTSPTSMPCRSTRYAATRASARRRRRCSSAPPAARSARR